MAVQGITELVSVIYSDAVKYSDYYLLQQGSATAIR